MPLGYCGGVAEPLGSEWNYLAEATLPVAIISLEDSIERRQDLHCMGLHKSVLAHYFPGIDNRNSFYDSEGAFLAALSSAYPNKNVLPGEVGCALSHLAVYRESLKLGLRWVLVLEDDCKIRDQDWKRKLGDLMDVVIADVDAQSQTVIHLGLPDWQIDNSSRRRVRTKSRALRGIVCPIEGRSTTWRAHAYVASQGFCREAVGRFDSAGLSWFADDWAAMRRSGLIKNFLVFRPGLLGQDDFARSTIRITESPRSSRQEVNVVSRISSKCRRISRGIEERLLDCSTV